MIENCAYTDKCNHRDCELNFCLKKYKLDSLFTAALFSETQKRRIPLYIDSDKTDIDEFSLLSSIEKDIINFITSGKNLYICSGQTGNGKTSWALRLVQEYFNKTWAKIDTGCHALFISVPKFLLAIKDSISNKNEYVEYIKNNVLDADIVIFDDIFHKTISEFEYTQLLNIIDSRISLGKSNIYTSNLVPENLKNTIDPRLFSRVINLSRQIRLNGGDKRILNKN